MSGLAWIHNPKWAWCQKCGKRSSYPWIELHRQGATCPHCGNKGTWYGKKDAVGAFRNTKKMCKYEGCVRGVEPQMGWSEVCHAHIQDERKKQGLK